MKIPGTYAALRAASWMVLSAAASWAAPAAAPVSLQVDLAAPGTPISPDLFGILFGWFGNR